MNGIERDRFGTTPDGQTVDRYTLRNATGMKVRLITFGAAVTELWTPDRNGRLDDVVLGFDDLESYVVRNPYFGVAVGRVAFRIAGAQFELDGKTYALTRNNGPHQLHGGRPGLSHLVWRAQPVEGPDPSVLLQCASPDGDQGYPGELRVGLLYSLTSDGALRLEFTAASDRPTPVNLTHHGYFNLSGDPSREVLDHEAQILAPQYCVPGPGGIPAGGLAPVAGTRFDLTKPTLLSTRPDADGKLGFDLGYLCRAAAGPLTPAAVVRHRPSGRTLTVETTEPAVIFYTGNALDGSLTGKRSVHYGRHAGFCLESGRLPDSVHHPEFPSVVLRPGQTYRHVCVYRFSAGD